MRGQARLGHIHEHVVTRTQDKRVFGVDDPSYIRVRRFPQYSILLSLFIPQAASSLYRRCLPIATLPGCFPFPPPSTVPSYSDRSQSGVFASLARASPIEGKRTPVSLFILFSFLALVSFTDLPAKLINGDNLLLSNPTFFFFVFFLFYETK